MKKIRLGIYIEDSEYGDRLTCYFMNHYKDQLEIHMYTMKEQLEHLEGEIDIMLSSELDQWNNKYIPLIQIVEETPIESEEGIYFVEKYQEVNRIVEEILKHVGGEVRDLKSEGSLIGQTRLISVYSLADNQYQMQTCHHGILRYIHLTLLLPELLEMADDKKLPFNTAVEISYLRNEEQQVLLQYMSNHNMVPSMKQAKELKQISKERMLTYSEIDQICMNESTEKVQVQITAKKLKQYFPDTYTKTQMEEIIFMLLASWAEREGEE